MDEIAVFEFRQARVFADDARFDFAADEEHRCARSVIGAVAAILFCTPSELGERHHADAVAVAALGEIAIERGDACRDGFEQIRVRPRETALPRVRVEAIERDVENPCAQPRIDQLCRQFQTPRECRSRVRHLRFVGLADLLQSLGAFVRVGCGASHEVEQVRLTHRAVTLGHIFDDLLLRLIVFAVRAAGSQLEIVERRNRRYAGGGTAQRERGDFITGGEVECGHRLRLECFADPTFGKILGSTCGVPNIHRAEVRLIGVRVADALHDARSGTVVQ